MENNGVRNNQQQDGMMIGLFAIGMIALFVWFFWWQYHGSISALTVKVRSLYEYPIYKMIGQSESLYKLAEIITPNTSKLCVPTTDQFGNFAGCFRKPESITYLELFASSIWVNAILGIICIILGFLGMQRYNIHPNKRFKKSHDVDSFMREQQANEPHLKLFTDFNLQKVNQNKGQFMGMLTTREFAKEHELVGGTTERIIEFTTSGTTKIQKDKTQRVPVVKKYELVKICRKQLGGLWLGIDNLTNEEAILLAMYLPRACSIDKNMSDNEFYKIEKNLNELEREFWDIATQDIFYSEKFKPDGYDENGDAYYEKRDRELDAFDIERYKKDFIEKYIDHPVAKDLLKKHAYTRTFIIAVVYNARRLGVLAPCQIRWLKFYNREIWALLQNVGRPSFFSENMGSIGHYQAEVVAKKALFQPNFEVAIMGFEHQLQSYRYSKEDFEFLGIDVSNIELFKDDEDKDEDEKESK